MAEQRRIRRRRIVIELGIKLFAFALFVLWLSMGAPVAQSPGVSAPVLKWQYGGCLSGPWCDTGWYSSPAVADLDGDGQPEVIWGGYDVVALNGTDGSLKWRASSPDRVWPGVAVADLTGDGTPEVIVGRSSDQLTVYDRFGDLHDLMRALMTLGFGTLLDQLSHKPQSEVLPSWQ